ENGDKMKTLFAVALVLCSAVRFGSARAEDQPVCAVTPTVHATAPHEDGVDPINADWYMNADHTVWAAASHLYAGKDGNKVAWIRPARVRLVITGRRLDGPPAPLQADTLGVYDTQFQVSGMTFPSAGCWEVIGKAGDKELRFVTLVTPKPPKAR